MVRNVWTILIWLFTDWLWKVFGSKKVDIPAHSKKVECPYFSPCEKVECPYFSP